MGTPSEYYGLSEVLADEGKPLERYKKHNNFCKVGEIKDERMKDVVSQKILTARKDCPVGPYSNSPIEDVDVVIPKDNAELTQKILRSDELKEFINKNYDKLKSGQVVNGSIEYKKPTLSELQEAGKNLLLEKNLNGVQMFNDQLGRFAALHNTDIVDAKMAPDGTVTMTVLDFYDFSRMPQNGDILEDGSVVKKGKIDNAISIINNNAYNQQKQGKLKPYVVYKTVRFKPQNLSSIYCDKINKRK